MRGQRAVVVGLGEVLWDLLPGGKQLGGAPANFAYHARAQGARGVVASCVGADPLGREILDRLVALGLETDFVAVDGAHPTGTVSVALEAGGKPRYIIHERAAWDFIPESAGLLALAREADAVCFGSLCQREAVSRATVRAFLGATREDCLRVFDINLRQNFYSRDVVESMLARSRVLKLNDEELPVVAGLLKLKGEGLPLLRALLGRFRLDLIALTRGERGSLLCTPGQVSDLPGSPVLVVDTVGAGDAFTAAVVMGLLRRAPLAGFHAHAERLARYVCTQPGATPPVPDGFLSGSPEWQGEQPLL